MVNSIKDKKITAAVKPVLTGKYGPSSRPPQSANLILSLGFEEIEIKDKLAYWKEVGDYGEHIILTSTEPDKILPYLRINSVGFSIPALVTIYKGPDLMENLVHKEIAYNGEDLEAIMHDMFLSTILPHYKKY
jgi:hypothetical protein